MRRQGVSRESSGMKQMVGLEIEVKVRVADLAALRQRLRKLRARVGKRVWEQNVLFDTPEGRLRRRDELLRLRTNDGAGVVTFKGRSLGKKALAGASGRKAKYKVRRELEFAVSDARAAAELLRGLGFGESFRYEKYRTELRLPGWKRAHVYLDETPMGTFLEIEGAPRAIDRAARQLGVTPGEYETRSYMALWAEHCRKRGLAAGDFVFPRKKKSRRGAVLR